MKEELTPANRRGECQAGRKAYFPRYFPLLWVMAGLFCPALFAVAMQIDSPCPLSINVKADSRNYRLGDAIEIEVCLINPGDQGIDFLPWNTPFDPGGSGNFFTVHRDGGEVAFLGRMIKRRAAEASDYRNLAPGATLHARLNLGALYDLTQPGEYRLTCKSPAIPGPGNMQQLCCNTITFSIEEKTP